MINGWGLLQNEHSTRIAFISILGGTGIMLAA